MLQKAFITGLAGPKLTSDERAFVAAERPAGLILFTRNCETAPQITQLVRDFKVAAGTQDLLVLIDQEGGRVQRLKPPLARLLPPAAAYVAHFPGDLEGAAAAARLIAQATALELKALGINTSCVPVLDVPVFGAHDVIGNRAYALDPDTIARLGLAVANGLMAGGVLPVMKHIPGHGRAVADSHFELPIVDAGEPTLTATDFAPFRDLKSLPAAMTAHVVFTALDADNPASTSAKITARIIRGTIGFDGLLMSDDLSMKALSGNMHQRTQAVLGAGSDLALHCNGDLAEMREVAAAAPRLIGRAAMRFQEALAVAAQPGIAVDNSSVETLLKRLLAPTA